MSQKITIVGLEEHIALPLVLDAWERAGVHPNPHGGWGDAPFARRLRSTGEERLADMDDQGIDMAVLSLNSPGVQNLSAADAPVVARDANDHLAAIVAERPDRFQAWAAIPTADPTAAATEIERAVTRLGMVGAMLYGRTGDVLADSLAYDEM